MHVCSDDSVRLVSGQGVFKQITKRTSTMNVSTKCYGIKEAVVGLFCFGSGSGSFARVTLRASIGFRELLQFGDTNPHWDGDPRCAKQIAQRAFVGEVHSPLFERDSMVV